ncbi:MAG: hypothetical protein L0Z62_13155 [Gemmataceae bacterium]|nr:hypothetical protein [Gemmataceae bacterium]
MHTPFLQIEVNRKRDLLLARRQARQVARLLGFDLLEQACVAALVFELARQQLSQAGRLTLRFAVAQDRLLIVAAFGEGTARVEKPLPRREPATAHDDLSWVVRELERLDPLNLFEEVQTQNQELLRVLLDRRALAEQLAEVRSAQAGPNAA